MGSSIPLLVCLHPRFALRSLLLLFFFCQLIFLNSSIQRESDRERGKNNLVPRSLVQKQIKWEFSVSGETGNLVSQKKSSDPLSVLSSPSPTPLRFGSVRSPRVNIFLMNLSQSIINGGFVDRPPKAYRFPSLCFL